MELISKTFSFVRSNWSVPAILVWFVAALGVPYQFLLQSTPSVMIVSLIHSLQTTEPGIGFLTSSFFYTYLLFQIPAGMLIDRFGVSCVLSASMILAGFTCVLFANANFFSVACFARLLMGLVAAPCVPAVMSVAARRFSAPHFVILAGMAESVGMLGGAIGESLLGSAVTTFGWNEGMVALGLIGFMIAALILLFINDSEQGAVDAATVGSKIKEIFIGLLAVIRYSQIWLIVLWGGLTFAMLPALAGLWVVQALQELHSAPLHAAVLGSTAMFSGTALGLPFWGWFSGRVSSARAVMFLATTLNLGLTSSFVYWHSFPLPIVYLQLSLMGFVSAVYVLAFAMVRDRTSSHVWASAMGLTNMMSMIIGAPLLQPLIGAVLSKRTMHGLNTTYDEVVSAYHCAFSSVVVCLLLAFLLIFFIKELKHD